MMNFEYIEESRKLKKKIIIFLGLMAIFTLSGVVILSLGFGDSLTFGVGMGLVLYLPGRLKGILKLGWLAAIILGFIFALIYTNVLGKLGIFGLIVSMLVPAADIGYSIYKMADAKKNG